MRSGRPGVDDCFVSPTSLHLTIDVSVDGDEISGHASDGPGPPTQFSGWLGLMGVLDVMLAATPSVDVGRPQARMYVGFPTLSDADAFAASDEVLAALRRYGATGPPGVWDVQHSGQGAAPITYQNRRTET